MHHAMVPPYSVNLLIVVTSWRSTLSGHHMALAGQKPRVNCKGIMAELCFVLMTYAYAHCLRGSEIVSSITDSEHSELQYNKVMCWIVDYDAYHTGELKNSRVCFRLQIC
jgi:hypothetical protein